MVMDSTMFYLRSRFHISEEFWEAPSLARLVVARAMDSLAGWTAESSSFPNWQSIGGTEDSDIDRESLPRTLVGVLSRGVPELTHKGQTLAERNAHANNVARLILHELSIRCDELRGALLAAATSDQISRRQGRPAQRLDEALQDVAFRIAICAYTGLYVANGTEGPKARQKAENTLSAVRKKKT